MVLMSGWSVSSLLEIWASTVHCFCFYEGWDDVHLSSWWSWGTLTLVELQWTGFGVDTWMWHVGQDCFLHSHSSMHCTNRKNIRYHLPFNAQPQFIKPGTCPVLFFTHCLKRDEEKTLMDLPALILTVQKKHPLHQIIQKNSNTGRCVWTKRKKLNQVMTLT